MLRLAKSGAVQAISMGLFVLVLATGLFGRQDTLANFAPTFVWVIWWVGLAYVVALIGNVWPAINPWSIIFGLAERWFGRRGKRLDLGMRYPPRLGVLPALVLFGIFAWIELSYETAALPRPLAVLILAYSTLTWAGMLVFGRDTWLARGEAFSIAFEVLGRFAPLGRSHHEAAKRSADIYLRPYAADLIVTRPIPFALTAFVLLMLATVTYDGFKETPHWGMLIEGVAGQPLVRPVLVGLHDAGLDVLTSLETVALALFPIAFLIVYLFFCWLAKTVSGTRTSLINIAGLFALSLVPIAVGYHLAHYLSYLLISGQRIIALASDPFGMGWDLFGTASLVPDIGIVGARFVWYASLAAIVLGHIFAVGVAHFVALGSFETRKSSVRSQYPFLVLMVAYTMVSLWILSQPITEERPDLNALRAQSETVTLDIVGTKEVCFELLPGDDMRYEFRSDAPVRFEIHHHEGPIVRVEVSMTAAEEHAGRFVAERAQIYCLLWMNPNLSLTNLWYLAVGPRPASLVEVQ